jgi:putative peptide zinc metalloprotease protein
VSDALFSPSWYRVAALKPRIRAHAVIHRHAYRDKVWFVLQDHAAGRSHRFSPAAHHFIGLMDGERTVQQMWEAASAHLGDAAPTQEEVIRLLGQLHSADALLCDVPPDSMEVFRRHQRHERMEWRRRLWTPLALRFPLIDPDRFLERTLPVVRPLFGWLGALLWLAVVGTGMVLAASHWTDLTENVMDRVLAPQNLLLLWLVYPAVKALHELGHAYATKRWGGEVHEIGIMLLVLTPVPYVDASASWGFRDKYQRMVVGAAGIGVELFLGSLALFVWLSVEPGAVSSVAYNVMLISGISTLLFNGNPLLRFDGYYVLADAIEIPNLGTRANKYLGYLFQR